MLGRLLGGGSEVRTVTAQSLFESGRELPRQTYSGVAITQDNAFRIGAFYAAVRLISDTISTLPIDTFYRFDGSRVPFRPRPTWVDQPEPDAARQRVDHYQSLLVSLLLDGNAFTRILRNGSGDVIALAVLDPKRVEVRRRKGDNRIEFVFDRSTVIDEQDMVHIPELLAPGAIRGVSRTNELRETLGLSKALEDFSAAFFGNGSHAGGVIEAPFEVNEEQAEKIKNKWEANHRGLRRSHRPGVLSGGAKFVKTSVEPNEAQMLESREFAVEEIARIFRIPPAMLQSTKPGATAYASREQDALQFVTFTLLPYIQKIEGAYSRLLPGNAFLKFNVDSLLRASLNDRFAAYSQGVQGGFMSINDIHKIEDMSPVDGGDVYRVPLANVNLDAANIVETEKRVGMVSKLVALGYDPEAVLAAVGLPAIKHTGLPSVQLQAVTQIDPINPDAVYPAG